MAARRTTTAVKTNTAEKKGTEKYTLKAKMNV